MKYDNETKSNTYLVTEEKIRSGLGRLSRPFFPEELPELAEYARRMTPRKEWREAIELGEIAAWERAHALVVLLQDFFRACNGLPGSFMPAEPGAVVATAHVARSMPAAGPLPEKERPDEDAAAFKALRQSAGQYSHDPSWKNGGIPACGQDHSSTKRERENVQGIAAFFSVVACGGIPELAWFYAGSAFELGMSSSMEAMVAQLIRGGTSAERGAGSAPSGPGHLQQAAAFQQRRILAALSRLPHRYQEKLALAYADRRYRREMVNDYGLGVVAIVHWAMNVSRETEPGEGALAELLKAVRIDWPTYTPSDGSLKSRIRAAADFLLWIAHALYRAEAHPPSTSAIVRGILRKRGSLGRKVTRVVRFQAGNKGSKRRQLVEVTTVPKVRTFFEVARAVGA